jgi:putative transposase
MPYWRIFYHLVWAFKQREALLSPELEERLYSYFREKARLSKYSLLAVNGCKDHVHLIISVPPSIPVSSVVQKLKGASAHEFHLNWQASYGVFSISQRLLPVAIAYVENQKKHHAEGLVNHWAEFCDEEPFEMGHRTNEAVDGYSSDEIIF